MGQTLSATFDVLDCDTVRDSHISLKEFKKRVTLQSEWIVIEPGDKKILKILKENTIFIDESLFQKNIKVHVHPQIQDIQYFGMPFSQEINQIALHPETLKVFLDQPANQVLDEHPEVRKLYQYFASQLEELR